MSRILFVCMGNICRSPTAEAVLRSLAARMAPDFELVVDSAGTHGHHVGEPPDERAQRVAARHGVDMSQLRARLLSPEDFARFDEVRVMDRQNLSDARALAPRRYHDRVQLLLQEIPASEPRDVPDPYYGSSADFERVYQIIEQAVERLLQRLRTR